MNGQQESSKSKEKSTQLVDLSDGRDPERLRRDQQSLTINTSDQIKLTTGEVLRKVYYCNSMAALQDPTIQRFVNQETQRQRFQALVHEMTGRCWDNCMGNPSTKLDSKTENCIRNCVERFLDTSNYVVNRLESTPLSPSIRSTKPSTETKKSGYFWN